MMSSSIPTTLAHPVLLAALLGGFLLAVPTAARPQSVPPGRALLNRFEAAPGHSGPSFARVRALVPIDDFSDGERALLNRSRTPDRPLADQGAEPIAKQARLLSFATIFAGVDPGQFSVWEGRLSGPEGGQLRLSLWQAEPAGAAANPVWHVRTRWEVRPGVDAHAFVAEMEGTVDWKAGTAHLSGVVTSGWQKGTWMEAEVRFVQGDAQGTLQVVRSRT